MRFFLSLLCICLSLSAKTQVNMDDISERLSYYGDVMVSALEYNHREYASSQFYNDFIQLLDSTNLYNASLDNLRTISVIDEDAGRFRLLSWQLEKAAFEFEYHAFLVWPDGTYVEFKQTRSPDKSIQYMELEPDNWYGALYYNLVAFDKDTYLLFGYNGYGQYDHIKIADVLRVEGENIVLGKEVFEDRKDKGMFNNRILLKYSSDAAVNLNYNPGLKMIVMDHLMPRMGKQEGQGPTMIPDGTYEGFEMLEGKWKYISKLYNHSYGENNAPRPKPVFDDNKDKNLFGKKN